MDEYNEWVPAGHLVRALFAMVAGIVVIASLAVLLYSRASLMENISGISLSWVVLAFLVFIFWNYRGLRIRIKNNSLMLTYGLFDKKSFQLTDIVSCKKTRALGRYLGIGIRYGLDHSIAYTTSFGNAVEITLREGRVFVFSSRNPDRVCEIIEAFRR